MKIVYRKQFMKQYNKLQRRGQLAVQDTIADFQRNPQELSLRNHALKGPMKGKRALAAGFDLRIIFEEHDNYMLVIMLDVGPHDVVYG